MSNRKVLILTHRLGLNFGGMLQAYALQKVLKDMGFEPETSNFLKRDKAKRIRYQGRYIIRRVLHFFGLKVSDLPTNYPDFIMNHTSQFVEKYIITKSSVLLNERFVESNYHAMISGSDQVWRHSYVPVERYMFDFAEQSKKIIRISYAASFGKDNLSEYPKHLLKKTSRLASKFSGISVREDTGVDLVEKHWGLRADQHVDPTLLLDLKDYFELINDERANLGETPGELFIYLLDREKEKMDIAQVIGKKLGLTTFEVMPRKPRTRKELFGEPESFQLPSVAKWLKSFADAQFIVTDSFHGTVFSILFHKPFLAIGNSERGLTRFSSLLNLFGLEDRLITKVDELSDEIIFAQIDWSEIERKRGKEVEKSKAYLRKHLEGL